MKNLAWKNSNPCVDESSRNTGSVNSASTSACKIISAANETAIAARNLSMNDNSNPQQGNKYTESSTDAKADVKKLFIGGLPNCVTDDVFFQYFEKFGRPVDSVVIYDKLTKRSRGFGFVTFEDSSSAQSVIELAQKDDNKIVILGRRCEVKIAYPKPLYTASENQQRPLQNNGRGKDHGTHKTNVNECIGSMWQQECHMWPGDFRQAGSTTGSDCLNFNLHAPTSVNNYYGHFTHHNYPYINETYLAHGYGEQYLGDFSQTEKSLSPFLTGPVFYTPYADYVGMKNFSAPPLFYAGNGNHYIDGVADYAIVPTVFPYQTSSLPDIPELSDHGHPATAVVGVPIKKESPPQTKLNESMNSDTPDLGLVCENKIQASVG